MKDISQKTFVYSSWTLSTPSCMENWSANNGLQDTIERVRREEGHWEWLFSSQSTVICHQCIISLGYRGSCGGKLVAEVSHSHEFYERFARKLHLRKYIWWLWFPRQHNWVICNILAFHGHRSKCCQSLACQTLELFQNHQAGPLLNYTHMHAHRPFRSPQCMMRSVLALLMAVASTLLICWGWNSEGIKTTLCPRSLARGLESKFL